MKTPRASIDTRPLLAALRTLEAAVLALPAERRAAAVALGVERLRRLRPLRRRPAEGDERQLKLHES